MKKRHSKIAQLTRELTMVAVAREKDGNGKSTARHGVRCHFRRRDRGAVYDNPTTTLTEVVT